MEHLEKKVGRMRFHLSGKICWAVGSCHDGRSEEINERFDAPDEKAAIEKARGILDVCHGRYSHLTDYGYSLNAELSIFKPI